LKRILKPDFLGAAKSVKFHKVVVFLLAYFDVKVFQQTNEFSKGVHFYNLHLPHLKPGIYMYTLDFMTEQLSKKMIVK